jgi:DNA processing protein
VEFEELAAWLRLSLTPGVGNSSARKLLAAFGSAQSIFKQPAAALQQVVHAGQASALGTTPAELAELLDNTWAWLEGGAKDGVQHRVLVLGDPGYPSALLNIGDPPLLLYLMGAGNCSLDPAKSLAVVGSRNPTPQGAANARQFSKTLAQAGLTIVSGLALGVDGAAHEGALDSLSPGSSRLVTVAVVGTGLDRVYPKQHRDLAHRIARNGCLISEYLLGTPPLTENFPRRNRLIAGLAQGTLVVEAALKSGSLITARLSAEQGKDVFAIPGSIHSPQARGCHALIKQGAKLVESAQDVLEELKLEFSMASGPASNTAPTPGDETELGAADALLEALGFDPVGLDALQARCGLETPELQAQLMSLELEAQVARLPGGLFQRLRSK